MSALRSILAQKMKSNVVFVVDEINFETPKTKAALEFLKAMNLGKRTLFVDNTRNTNLQRSVRNLETAKFTSVASFNVVDALNYTNLVISKTAFNQLTRMLEK